ncbi:MAG: protein translocase subunit SecF [bacterium]
MFVIKYRKIFYTFSIILFAVAFYGIFAFGLKLGIDFNGGVIVDMSYTTKPDTSIINPALEKLNIGDYSLRASGANDVILRTKNLTDAERNEVLAALSLGGETPTVKTFDAVGPILGAELQKKSMYAVSMVLLAIVLFITFAFRHVSKPVSSWKYGIVAVIALFHDVFIPIGFFAFLGHFYGVEVDSLFVTAILVVLGFSVHDTIVVFDRTRENLRLNESEKQKKEFDQIVGESVSQTFVRSINTSLTVLIALVILYFTGPAATKDFSLALLVGIIAGTYSSIFIGSPLLVTLQKFSSRKK